MATKLDQTPEQVLRQRLTMALGHLMAAGGAVQHLPWAADKLRNLQRETIALLKAIESEACDGTRKG